MSSISERGAEALNIIGSNPGIEVGKLSARCTLSNSKTLGFMLKEMLQEGMVIRTGDVGTASCYHLTDKGQAKLAELADGNLAEADSAGADQDVDAGDSATADNDAEAFIDAVAGALTVGFGDVVLEQESEPLPVIDSDRTSLDEALAQLSELVAESPRPVNLSDLIEFNRRGAELIRHQAPVPAALMESTANALERAYSQ